MSKSNSGNIYPITACKEWIREKNHTLLEYLGGRYDPELIKSADMVILVPPSEVKSGLFTVGKGQWSESEVKPDKTFVFIMESNQIYTIAERKVIDLTNYQKTGSILISNTPALL